MARSMSKPRGQNWHCRLLMALSCLVLCLALLQLLLTMMWISYTTISSAPLFSVHNFSTSSAMIKENPNKVFLTVMVGPLYKEKGERRRVYLEKSASQMFAMEHIHFYTDFPDFILENPTFAPHLEFLKNATSPTSRGAGFWFWKPVLILHHLEQMDYGDILFYSDTDLVDVHFSWNEVQEVMDFMDNITANVAIFYSTETERFWNKRDVYQHYCPHLDPNDDKSHSYAAGWHIIRKTPGSLRFYQDWVTGISNLHFIDDSPSILENIKSFHEHRHDQSNMNLLLKCRYKEPRKIEFPKRLWTRVMTFQFPD